MHHLCHWPGCQLHVSPHLWGCKAHWLMLPTGIRNEILRHYVRGQEKRKDPSPAYLEAADRADKWAREWMRAQGVTRPDAEFVPLKKSDPLSRGTESSEHPRDPVDDSSMYKYGGMDWIEREGPG